MRWNWQQADWPNFRYNANGLAHAEAQFQKQGGILIGAFKHLRPDDEDELTAELLTSEAMTTSAIEGEVLDRWSVRASILRSLGLTPDSRRAGPREQGIAEMTTDLMRVFEQYLTHQKLFEWHRMLMRDRTDLQDIGAYRTHPDDMEIESGPEGRKKVHFVAPPSSEIPREMEGFIAWFNRSRVGIAPVARAGIAHLYFESLHPFEDGNGRIGRAISEVALAQGLGHASLTLLSTETEARLKEYYRALELASRENEVTAWLEWFSGAVLAGQRRTHAWIEFLIAKTRTLDALRGRMNARQERALLRMFQEGPAGFASGMSSGNYQRITGAPPATARRDLADLVELGALRRTGTGKGTRYWLPL